MSAQPIKLLADPVATVKIEAFERGRLAGLNEALTDLTLWVTDYPRPGLNAPRSEWNAYITFTREFWAFIDSARKKAKA